MVRKELREHIFKMLFQIEFNDPQEMPEQIEYYFSTLEDAAAVSYTHLTLPTT